MKQWAIMEEQECHEGNGWDDEKEVVTEGGREGEKEQGRTEKKGGR